MPYPDYLAFLVLKRGFLKAHQGHFIGEIENTFQLQSLGDFHLPVVEPFQAPSSDAFSPQ
jgi:hypothetical protein